MGSVAGGNEGIGVGVPNRTLVVSDNLPALAAMPAGCVDLIYLDPPFNSKKEYSNPINIPEEYAHTLYRDYTEMGVKVVEPSFSDQWSMELYLKDEGGNIYPNPNWKHQWVTAIAESYPALHSVLTSAGQAQDEGLQGYLTFMAVRLLQMRRVLRETGSIYLHCDPTASHYLKAVMDCIFGPDNFRNEIIWQRTITRKGNLTRGLARDTDMILRYSKSGAFTWNPQAVTQPYDLSDLDEKTRRKYCNLDQAGRRYQLTSVTAPTQNPKSKLTYEVMGVVRTWRWTKERMEREIANGRVVQTKAGNVPRQIRYLDEQKGKTLNNVWTDIPAINSQANERTKYPTQKPLALLERIIAASSNPGDVVLDPFAGCATACVAAERLERRWLGIEIGDEGYRQVVQRMRDTVKVASKDTPLLLEPERVITRLEELPGQRLDYPLVPQPEARRVGGRTAPAPRVRVEDRTKQWLFGVQQGYCIGCAASIPIYLLSIDHVVPRAAGGPEEEWNYQLLCSYCNPVKGDRLTTQELWAVNLESGVLTDIERVRRLWKAREAERRGKGFERWLGG